MHASWVLLLYHLCTRLASTLARVSKSFPTACKRHGLTRALPFVRPPRLVHRACQIASPLASYEVARAGGPLSYQNDSQPYIDLASWTLSMTENSRLASCFWSVVLRTARHPPSSRITPERSDQGTSLLGDLRQDAPLIGSQWYPRPHLHAPTPCRGCVRAAL